METLNRLLQLLSYDPQQPLLFTSGLFLVLMLFFLLGYYLLQTQRTARLAFVTLFSYYFFYKNSGLYFGLLAVVTITDFHLARCIAQLRQTSPRKAKACLWLSLAVDLGLLAYFKYANFFGETIAAIVRCNFQPWDIVLPVGISFFTFKSISYVADVYRGHIKPLSSLLDYAFHVSFFPVLLAGPIVRAADFLPQLHKKVTVSPEMFARGTFLIAMGLVKKAVVSDYISQNFVDRVFEMPSMFSGGEILLGLYGYCVQLYCDFSGYSDIAIGLALWLGFHIPDNFNAPFKADSLSDFWRRWHISLSTWIRDYIYIPLGGNRKGRWRAYLNQMVAMTLCGLWHGASLSFVLWGALHGAGVCLHKWFQQVVFRHDRYYHPSGWRRVVAVLLTFHLVVLLWLPFRADSLEKAWNMLHQMLTKFSLEVLPQVVWAYRYVFLLMGVTLVAHFLPRKANRRAVKLLQRMGVLGSAIVLTLVIVLVIQVKGNQVLPFIYFQF